MKSKLIISAAALTLLAAGPLYPRQEQEKEKPPQQQEQKQPEQKQKQQSDKQQQKEKQQADKQQQQEQQKQKQQADKQQQEQQKRQQQISKQQQQDEKARQKQQQQVAKSGNQHEQSGDRQRRDEGDHRGRRLPEKEFHSHFGREHTLRVAHSDDRHFRFGGYTFEFVEVWPAAWAYSDDCYVEEIDGEYYLIDLLHPEVRILVIIV